jgi:hypothetical protein
METPANNPSTHIGSALLRQLGAYGLLRGAHITGSIGHRVGGGVSCVGLELCMG